MTVSEMRSTTELVYTAENWERESYALFVERSDPAPCPECGRTGFFGPRARDPGRKFRACRFCGFWQVVGQSPIRLVPMVHDCSEWPECARAAKNRKPPLTLSSEYAYRLPEFDLQGCPIGRCGK